MSLALDGKGLGPQERMRVYLGCEKPPPPVDAYDFRKGRVTFEYKHSTLMSRNKRSRQRRSGPTKGWQFNNLRGANRRKHYDYLILEGDCETDGGSKLFRI
jgi:hypothetical protein